MMNKLSLLAVAVALAGATAAWAEPVDGSYTLRRYRGLCAFRVNLEVTGMIDELALRDGRFITTNPGAWVTVSNAGDPTKRITLNITGATHASTDAAGVTTYVYTGRNLNWDPYAGFVLIVGDFSWLSDGSRPLSGTGTMTPVCPLIE